MSREWKPGDVAMVNDTTRPEAPWKVAMCVASKVPGIAETRWRIDTGEVWGSVSQARPLVVIDPEDRDAVERLTREVVGFDFDLGVDRMQAALREYANPTPPKPDEPTGWLAVVKDADGDKWVRDGLPNDRATRGEWWNHSCAARDYVGDLRADYADIAAVRVLSPGVEVDQ